MSSPQVCFGCASIGKSYTTAEQVTALLHSLSKAGIKHLDTAARYPPTSPGLSEKLLGEAECGKKGEFSVNTKVLISGDGSGSLTETAIGKSLDQSYQSLGVSEINILYCHGPDKQTPITEQAAAFDKYFKQGKFTHLGVSNFSISMLREWLEIAEREGYVKPTYYQGQYNLICRAYEDELFPFLKENNIHFYAYSPLAGGFLTGKLTPQTEGNSLKGTRFEIADDNPFGKAFRHWYDKPEMHRTIAELKSITDKAGLSMEAAALRWLMYHSELHDKDAVIIGASRVSQLENTKKILSMGPLPDSIVTELKGLWDICKDAARTIVNY